MRGMLLISVPRRDGSCMEEVSTVKKATRSQHRSAQNLWGLIKPHKQTAQHSAAARRARKPARGFGARTSAKKEGVVSKVLRSLKLKS